MWPERRAGAGAPGTTTAEPLRPSAFRPHVALMVSTSPGSLAASLTIKDVARHAGVSVSTVSNVLNGRTDRMRPSTLDRVSAVIGELGYAPSRAAREMRTQDNTMVALLVPSVANPFWGSFALAVEESARRRGYSVFLCNTLRDVERERQYLTELWAGGVRRVILASSSASLGHVRDLIARGLRVVAFDSEVEASTELARLTISTDNRRGAELAAGHLLALGHRRIALISPPIRTAGRAARRQGCFDAFRAAGVSPSELIVWEGGEQGHFGDSEAAELGRAGAYAVLSGAQRPTALFAINDFCAIGCLAAARELGLRVPEDVSVIGFDDVPISRLMDPPLTTIRQPVEAIAEAAIASMAEAADGAFGLTLELELIRRDSTAAPRDSALVPL